MGILVTAVVLGISGQSDMSDEDIILRAKNLGMVFQEDITDDAEKPDIVKTPKPTEEATGVPKEAASARPEAEEVTPEAINTNKPAENPAPKILFSGFAPPLRGICRVRAGDLPCKNDLSML